MKNKRHLLGIALIVSALAFLGCNLSRVEPTAPSEAPPTVPSAPGVAVPDAAVACNVALDYISANHSDQAPPAGLAWEEANITPQGLVGSSTFQYTAGDWVITVSFPIVPPENTVYRVVVDNQATGFHWEGDVNAAGQVTELAVSTGEEGGAEPPAGWAMYTNPLYGYSFYYPPEVTITESGVMGFPPEEVPAGMSNDEYFAQLEALYGNNLCVSVAYQYGYINISSPDNQEFRYAICGRTGVGVGTMTDKSDTVVIAGETCTSTGFEFIGEEVPCDALVCHNETLVIQLADGTRIEYGASPLDSVTYDDYLATTRPVLLQIIATFVPGE